VLKSGAQLKVKTEKAEISVMNAFFMIIMGMADRRDRMANKRL
jgi:hypothetical protein